jgi:hypothetical protein
MTGADGFRKTTNQAAIAAILQFAMHRMRQGERNSREPLIKSATA